LPLAGLMLCLATVNAVFNVVGRAHVPAKIRAINFDLTSNRTAFRLRADCFTQFVSKDEGSLILAV
jgi:hypothetical protein